MKITHFKTAMAVLGLAVLAVFLMVPFPALSQGGPELICEPNKGAYGLQVFLKGNGFAPNTQVQIEAFGQTIAPQSDNTGQFMVIAFAPTDEAKYKPGEYTLIAKDSAGASAEAIFTLQVLQTAVRPTESGAATSDGGETTSPPPPPGASEAAPTATQAAPAGVTPAPAEPAGGEGLSTVAIIVIAAGVVGLLLLAVAIFFTLARRKEPVCPPEEQPARPQTLRPRDASAPQPASKPQAAAPAQEADDSRPLTQGETTLVMPAVPKLSTRPTLQIMEGEGEGTVFSLEQKTTVLGRGEDCDVVINHPMVSRHHAKIVRVGPSFYIHDLQSTNGTMVNGENIDQHVLQPEDEIQIGVTLLLFQQPKVE